MPLLIRGPTSQAAPSEYTLAPREAFIPEAVTATFNGAGAAAAFLPTLSIYAQSGELLARCPATEVAAGSSAEVTFAPLLRAAASAGTAYEGKWATLTTITHVPGIAAGATEVPTFRTGVGQDFDTNDPSYFTQDRNDDPANGFAGGILVMQPGVYMFSTTAVCSSNVEPLASYMNCTWTYFHDPPSGGPLSYHEGSASALGDSVTGTAFPGVTGRWAPVARQPFWIETPVTDPNQFAQSMGWLISLTSGAANPMPYKAYILVERMSDVGSSIGI